LLGHDLRTLNGVLTDYFGGEGTAEANIKAAQAGFDYARQNYKGNFDGQIIPHARPVKRMLINGNEAIALGAIAAGCKFMSGYPMTPITPILEYMVAKSADLGLAVVQPEDEIAAMNMAIGANYTGVRAMTATSGSGFCLMTEGLGLAGITETPMVVVEGQRPGPAVGMPTRTEQGDLEFVIHAHQGDFPRAVLAPADAASAFWLTIKAFNLAEKYQMPVIIMSDHYLGNSYFTVDRFDLSKVTIDRGALYSDDGKPSEYKRHKDTLSGISPRAFPGLSEALVVTDADEHDEEGHLNESIEIRNQQMAKRGRKLFELKHRDIAAPELIGPKRADITLVGWGSTYGPIREAMEIMRKEGQSVNFLPLTELWPFPAEAVTDVLRRRHPVYVIENNFSGQLSHLIQAETGKKVENRILRFDGRPFTPEYIVEQVKKGQGE
jgi:2-oxoglutarate ferredoxin oxidoreductase subunit alpha